MPEKVFWNYLMTGPATNIIYSQTEMARVLGITETRLVGELEQGKAGLMFHAHPSTVGEYKFNIGYHQTNIKYRQCYRDGGHDLHPDSTYDYLPKGALSCRCGHTKYLQKGKYYGSIS